MGKQGVGCGAKCAKYLLFVFNFIFWLTGLGLLVVGIWMLADSESLVDQVEYIITIAGVNDTTSLQTTAIVFMVAGGFVGIVGFCGCCGACKENKCLLVMYMVFLVIVFGVEVAGGVLTLVYRDDVTGEIKKQGRTILQEQYMDDNSDISLAFNFLFQEFECCGLNGPVDFLQSAYYGVNMSSTVWRRCCTPASSDSISGDRYEPKDERMCLSKAKSCAESPSGCDITNEYFYKKGCVDALVEYIEDNYLTFIVVILVVAGLEIFGFIFSCCLCRAIE